LPETARFKLCGYNCRKLRDDRLDQGEKRCSTGVARIGCLAGNRAQIGCKRCHGIYGGRLAIAIGNALDRRFDVATPDTARAADITYI
jgi:putative transposase